MSIEKEFGTIGTWVKKNAKYLVIVAFIWLLIGTPVGMSLLGIVNPGFPGAQSACYGVQFNGWPGWTGNGVLYAAADAQTTDLLSHSAIGMGDHVFWGGTSPEAMTVVYRHDLPSGSNEQQLSTEIQNQIPLASFNYQNSTPLTISNNMSAWDQGEILQYWNVQATTPTNQTLSNGTILSSVTYTATSQSLLLIPGNFYLSIYIPPSQANAGTGSGWEEGTWSSVDFWYMIYWYEWLNAYGEVLKANEATPNIPANALNRQDQFNLRGGFPIAGWIQGYESPIQTSTGTIYDLYSIQTEGANTKTYAGSQVSASTLANILNQISLNPSLTGRQVTLYTTPGGSYQLPTYTLGSGPIDAQAQGLLQSPDWQTTLPTEYFKISINTFGTYTEGTYFSGFTVYYPTINYLLRFIFGVYGVHTYVWTVSTAMSQGYNATGNYQTPPAQWQNRTILEANTAGFLTGLTDWFSNPWNDLQFYFIVIVIAVLIITVLNPGLWAGVLGRRKEKS
jgi:hypothetical protein